MSNNRIFTNRHEVVGRNANIAMNMSKRAPIFTHMPIEKQEVSPFSNYKLGGSSLSESQVVDFEDRITNNTTTQNIRRIVSEELQRSLSLEDMGKKQISTLQAQINDLKDRFAEYQKSYFQKTQEKQLNLKQQIKAETEAYSKQIQMKISLGLRNFIGKLQTETKKEILQEVGNQFLPVSFVEDLKTEIEEFDDRISQLQERGSEEVSLKDYPKNRTTALNESAEIRLNKIQREIEATKKSLQTSIHNYKESEGQRDNLRKRVDRVEELEKYFNYQNDKIKEYEQEILRLDKSISQLGIKVNENETDFHNFKSKITDIEKSRDQHDFLIKKLSSGYESFNKRQPQKGAINNFLNSDNFDTSIVLNSSNMVTSLRQNESSNSQQNQSTKIQQKRPTVTSQNQLINAQLNHMPKKQSNEQTSPIKIPTKNPANEKIGKENNMDQQQKISKSIYQIDRDGYLMDGDGRYLLTEDNKMVKLTNEQVKVLTESDSIEMF